MKSLKEMTNAELHDLLELVISAIRESGDPTELRIFRKKIAAEIIIRGA